MRLNSLPSSFHQSVARPAALAAAALMLTALPACSVLEGDKVDYRSASKGRSLEVPPDLTALPKNRQYEMADGSVSAKKVNAQANNQVVTAGTSAVGDIEVKRAGNKSWLLVKRPSDKVWPMIDEFWIDNGFTVARSDRKLGIVETDWAENRAKLPQDFIRETVGRIFDALYSTGERDKFRTRIESVDGGAATEVYITHRGMVEKVTENIENTMWEPRSSDPELEAEFLRRMMLRLGLTEEQSKTLMAREATIDTIKYHKDTNPPKILINENFNSAWRRVGIALDRAGFTIADKDRSKGSYFVRYSTAKEGQKPGFFGRLFGAKDGAQASTTTYTVQVDALNADNARVTVLSEAGQSVEQQTSEAILEVLKDTF